jgi:deoxyadenosine/deoxycytidine kinase
MKVVIVEGIIGAGKSVLAKELGRALGPSTLLLLEPDEKKNANPYLAS